MSDSQKGLLYIPPPAPVLPDFYRQLKNIVGRAPSGEPYLRFVWGMDRKDQSGKFCRYHDCLNTPAKYVGVMRWVLEGWQSPDVYDRREWERHAKTLGAFPTQGVWDFIALVETPGKQFLNLGSRALQMAREWRHWKSKPKKRTVEALLEQQAKVQQLQERNWQEAKEKILDDFVEEYARALENPKNREYSLPPVKKKKSVLILPPLVRGN